MSDFFAGPGEPPPAGFRLIKLELYNWGTFDSSLGHVHTVHPAGASTLLIGQNGSGKSTLVDAILTLLVRPGIRNYNVAAGAHKLERDERTYIKGAYGRSSRDDDNRAEVHYLRPKGQHYSALLACFRNDIGAAFSVAQVLAIGPDGTVDKVYCFANSERSIAADLANLASTDRMRQELVKRGFRATTTYREYLEWFVQATGVKPKAMEMFNQTVAVKDIQSLNRFIRDHMLTAKPWAEKVANLQNHVTALSEAHKSLVQVRKQFALLVPIVTIGADYEDCAGELAQARRLLAAADSYFRQQTVDLGEPYCLQQEEVLRQCTVTKGEQDEQLEQKRDQIRQLTNEIEQAGGDRLKLLPGLIDAARLQAQSKREVYQQVRRAAAKLALPGDLHDAASLALVHSRLPELTASLTHETTTLEQERDEDVVNRADLNRQRADDQAELTALEQRQGNLPESLAALRRRLCEDLRLPEKDLPFVAELVSVKVDQRDWQASIEMVLHGLALSLLVADRHYQVVAAYIDRTRLADAQGRGQRLTYLRVGERGMSAGVHAPSTAQSMVRKLELRDTHLLFPWVKAELEERYDFRCCETIEEFQMANGLAMTRSRHIKQRGARHDKDDRESVVNPRSFVLGWDNREKCQHLRTAIARFSVEITAYDQAILQRKHLLDQLQEKKLAVGQIQAVAEFSAIDFAQFEREKTALEEEKRVLEEGNESIQMLQARRTELHGLIATLSQERDATIKREGIVAQTLKQARQLVLNAQRYLQEREVAGTLAAQVRDYPQVATALGNETIMFDALPGIEAEFTKSGRKVAERLERDLAPLQEALTSAMNSYLRSIPAAEADLNAQVKYLSSFRSLHEQIQRDDLPRHEARFKESLNEKVIQEIGFLNAAFTTERQEIMGKITVLNQALRQLEYRPGTYMRLDPRPVRDRDIEDFQGSLRACLANTFENTPVANEERYVLIEAFLARLRENPRWCEKVTDVRRWFDFVAHEQDAQTDLEKAYYEDSTGQSGGEKAKLAFTILVAAIAYQYDLDPMRPASDRFRFVVVDEMFSKVDDQYAEYALALFAKFGLQLLIVAPLDAKARVTEPHVGCYLHVVKDPQTNHSEIFSMTAREFESAILSAPAAEGIALAGAAEPTPSPAVIPEPLA